MERKEQEVAEEYLSSLADLNLNSKPLINMLTILAEENIEYAPIIVKSVEQHISKVNPDVKLPVLYLIDSIVKNVGREYILLFSHSIVNIFCGVFEKVNEKIREKMYTLRQTWNDVFTTQKLYTLDVKVNFMDPNWPITAKVVPKTPAIHLNPNFLKSKTEPLNEMQAQLRDKQRQLLELQKRKLELELAATKQRLEEQEKQLSMQADSVKALALPGPAPPVNTQRGVFSSYKIPPRHPIVPAIPTNVLPAGSTLGKVRVAPVNPGMISTLRHRDPRLARQQQMIHQQIQSSEATSTTATITSKTAAGVEDVTSTVDGLQDPKKNDDDVVMDKLVSRSNSVLKSHYGNKDKLKLSTINSSISSKKVQPKGGNEKSSLVDKSPTRMLSNSRNRTKAGNGTSTSASGGTQSKSYDKDIRHKDKSHANAEKKKSKLNSPAKSSDKGHIPKTDKSPKRSSSEVHNKSSPPNASINKFKDLKLNTKSRNYIRRNRDKSKSPTPPKIRDLKVPVIPEKKLKLADSSSVDIIDAVKEEPAPMTTTTTTLPPPAIKDSNNPELEENLEAPSSKDIDLRQFQGKSTQIENNSGAIVAPQYAEAEVEVKKRPSTDNAEEPSAKKSKSEKLDVLFGSEDVDLRTMNNPAVQAIQSTGMPMTPPPPPIISNESENWAKVKGVQVPTSPTPKSNLEDVRAKLAKAAKCQLSKVDKPKDIRKSRRFVENQEDSQDGTDANIRTIMSQAQELYTSANIDDAQYNTLIKQVIQINETHKLKEAQRRESLLINKSTDKIENSSLTEEETKLPNEEEKEEDLVIKLKPLSKRLQKSMKDELNFNKEQAAIEKSTSPSKSMNHSDNRSNMMMKHEKRTRQRESKWSPWEPSVAPSQKAWAPANHKLPFPSKVSQHNVNNNNNNNNNRLAIPSPWQNPPPMIFAAAPPVPTVQIPPINPVCTEVIPPTQFSNSVDNPKSDVVRTITIDSMMKEIRIYDEVAVVFMDWDQPREIGFQNGQRRIIIDDQDPLILSFNNGYQNVLISGKTHKIRFGCPSRELYIDNNWYECCFGGPPLAIQLDSKMHVIKIEGPPPQVNIAHLRQDLVAGKINLIVDAHIIIPVFLDAKPQTFELNGTKHTVQFADSLLTVLFDNEPMQVEYGGLPKSLYLGGVKYFVRFSTLPNGIIPGKITIRDMISTNFVEKSEELQKPPLDEPVKSEGEQPAEVKAQVAAPLPAIVQTTNNDVDEVKPSLAEEPIKTDTSIAPPTAALNIDELFQKLIASGILNQSNNPVKAANGDEVTVVVDLSKPETIKTRQAGIVHKLFSGMQCSSCGVRFPPEQTMKYSQHLDWHFRQNRRERDTSRKAHSRKWYYDVSDWVQYEEIEDLEDREKNWFEAQQNDIDNMDESSNPKSSSPPPSCPAGPDDVDKVCDMCHDKFEQFYNEEFEEWHLRSAIRVDNKIYHPLCYQDYKASLNVVESNLSLQETEGDDNAVDSVVIVKEEISEEGAESAEQIMDEDDDDVIVVPLEEPSITEIPDDDDDEPTSVTVTTENIGSSDSVKVTETATPANRNDSIESDVEIEEPNIPFTDLDTYEEVAPKSISTIDESSQSSQFNNVRIKEEPKDESDDEDAFEDVGTFVSADDITQTIDEYVPQPSTNLGSGLDGLVSSIDGNVEIVDAPTSVGVNKIKINITKSVNTIHKSNTIANESISTIPVICNVQDTVSSRNETVITEDVPAVAKPLETDDSDAIEFVFKPELSNVKLDTVPKVESGYETSGLCSIM